MHDERSLLQRLASGPVSGDALAREAGLTRAAIWKRIDAVRAAGVPVDASRGRGYTLRHSVSLLDADAILARMPPPARTDLGALEVAWTLDSTNSELLRRAPPGPAAEVLFAERQTGGRGRRGRHWTSPLAAQVAFSVARRFEAGLARLGGLSLVAGVAVAEALDAFGVAGIGLKWPNDLVVREGGGLRKLGGILVEGGGEHAGPARAVIGIGINVRLPPEAGEAIDQPWTDVATCLGAAGEPPAAVDRNALAAMLLAHLLPALAAFDRDGLAPVLPRYARFDMLAGRAVTVRAGARTVEGLARGIAPDGGLRLDGPTGEQVVHAGEASVRPR